MSSKSVGIDEFISLLKIKVKLWFILIIWDSFKKLWLIWNILNWNVTTAQETRKKPI